MKFGSFIPPPEAKPDVPQLHNIVPSTLMIFTLFVWPTLLRTENIPTSIPEKHKRVCVWVSAYHGAISVRLCSRKMCASHSSCVFLPMRAFPCDEIDSSSYEGTARRFIDPGCCSDITEKTKLHNFFFRFLCCGSEVGNGNNLSRLWCYFPTEVTRSRTPTNTHTESHQHGRDEFS